MTGPEVLASQAAITRANGVARRLAHILADGSLTEADRAEARRYAVRFDTTLDELDAAVDRMERRIAEKQKAPVGGDVA